MLRAYAGALGAPGRCRRRSVRSSARADGFNASAIRPRLAPLSTPARPSQHLPPSLVRPRLCLLDSVPPSRTVRRGDATTGPMRQLCRPGPGPLGPTALSRGVADPGREQIERQQVIRLLEPFERSTQLSTPGAALLAWARLDDS